MSYRLTIIFSILLLFVCSFGAGAAPEFSVDSRESSIMNPNDYGVTVQEALAENFGRPVRIKELTIINYGTASENEMEGIHVQYETEEGNWTTAQLQDLTGVASGVTFSLPGNGVRLDSGEKSRFRFKVNVSSPDRIPVSKYGSPVSVELGVMYHYAYLNDEGEAIDSVSSTWYRDPNPDIIKRGGFEHAESVELDDQYLQPGTTEVIGEYTFVDRDLNDAGVQVNKVEVFNAQRTNNPLVFGQDLKELTLEVTIKDEERTITRKVDGPTSKVVFDLSSGSWWDGEVPDEGVVNVVVKGKVALDEVLSGGLSLRTGLNLKTKEKNGMSGFPFTRTAVTPADSLQSIELHGLEGMEETTVWRSKVVNQGETYRQKLSLKDRDANSSDFILTEVKLENEGSLANEDFEDISVFRVQEDGELDEIGTGLKFGGSWQNLGPESEATVPDQGESLIEIHYKVSPEAEDGGTFSPVVQFRGSEGAAKQVPGPLHKSEIDLTVRPKGAETVSVTRQLEGLPALRGDNRVLVQRIDVMDRDENRFDLFINPIVIKNAGTATGDDFEKVEIFDSSGELLVEKTDLDGLSTGGVTFSNLDGKTVVKDDQHGNWRSFYIYLTPSPTLETGQDRTVDLQTTLYQTEGREDYVSVVSGPKFSVKASRRFAEAFAAERRAEQDSRPEERSAASPSLTESGFPLNVGLGLGVSYSDTIGVDARLFGQYYFDLDEGGSAQNTGDAFNRIGVEIDSVNDQWYFSPYSTLAFEWGAADGVSQYAGAGAGVAFLSSTAGSSTAMSIHGTYGVKISDLFEGDLPVFTQGRVKYLLNPVGKAVFEIDLGVLYG